MAMGKMALPPQDKEYWEKVKIRARSHFMNMSDIEFEKHLINRAKTERKNPPNFEEYRLLVKENAKHYFKHLLDTEFEAYLDREEEYLKDMYMSDLTHYEAGTNVEYEYAFGRLGYALHMMY